MLADFEGAERNAVIYAANSHTARGRMNLYHRCLTNPQERYLLVREILVPCWVKGSLMMRMVCESGNEALWSSLNAIRQAQIRLHLLNCEGATPTVIYSRIQLCDVLLSEISVIRASLARHLKHTRGALPAGASQLHS